MRLCGCGGGCNCVCVHCAQVKWTFNGRDLDAGGRVVIRSSGELIISDLEVADSGNYTCTIWGLAGE